MPRQDCLYLKDSECHTQRHTDTQQVGKSTKLSSFSLMLEKIPKVSLSVLEGTQLCLMAHVLILVFLVRKRDRGHVCLGLNSIVNKRS